MSVQKPFVITIQLEGRGPKEIRKFATLGEIQAYVKSQWQGAEYIDGSTGFHTDYCRFELKGCTLADLGTRDGRAGTEEHYEWTWKSVVNDDARQAVIKAYLRIKNPNKELPIVLDRWMLLTGEKDNVRAFNALDAEAMKS